MYRGAIQQFRHHPDRQCSMGENQTAPRHVGQSLRLARLREIASRVAVTGWVSSASTSRRVETGYPHRAGPGAGSLATARTRSGDSSTDRARSGRRTNYRRKPFVTLNLCLSELRSYCPFFLVAVELVGGMPAEAGDPVRLQTKTARVADVTPGVDLDSGATPRAKPISADCGLNRAQGKGHQQDPVTRDNDRLNTGMGFPRSLTSNRTP